LKQIENMHGHWFIYIGQQEHAINFDSAQKFCGGLCPSKAEVRCCFFCCLHQTIQTIKMCTGFNVIKFTCELMFRPRWAFPRVVWCKQCLSAI